MHSFPSRRSSDLILSDEERADPFGDQRRLVLALDLDREFERLLPLARAFLVQFEQFEMAAHALARADGRQEKDLVAAVVDRKSVVKGKSVSVRVALGGSRIIQKQKHKIQSTKKNRKRQ